MKDSLYKNSAITTTRNAFAFAILIFLSSNIPAQTPTIHWAKYGIPPFFIDLGIDKNNGIIDRLFQVLQERLPQYQHVNYQSNIIRIARDLQQTKLICSGLLKTAQRAKIMHYSSAAIIVPRHSLQFLVINEAHLTTKLAGALPDQLSIKALLSAYPDSKIGIIEKRSYGKRLNQLIQQYPNSFVLLDSGFGTKELFTLMRRKRVDFIIEYPIASYYTQRAHRDFHFKNITILETLNDQNVYGHIVCSKNKLGEAVITSINHIINTQKNNLAYQNIVKKWLPKDLYPLFNQQYKQFLGQ